MTFLEVLLAISLLGLLLVGGSTVLFSLSRAYFTLETSPQFERHTKGVAELLHYLAAFSADPNAPAGLHFGWEESPASKKPTLSFSIDRDVPFFVSERVPLPPVRAYLEYDKDHGQFWLAWHPDPAFTDGKVELQYSLLSPWAEDIEFGYYDEGQKSWEFETASSDNRQHGDERPARIRLIFENEGAIIYENLRMEAQNRNVLVY